MNKQIELKLTKKTLSIYNFILLLVGQFISVFGSQIFTFATAFYILNKTGSGLAFSISLIVQFLPKTVISPIAGAFADRFDRRLLTISSDIVSGISVLGIFLYFSFNDPSILLIYFSLFVLSITENVFRISLRTLIPDVFDSNHISKVNSYSQSISSFSRILGPLVGGLIFLISDIKIFYIINGISFFVSAIFLFLLRYETNRTNGQNINNKGVIRQGINYLRDNKLIRLFFIISIFANFVFHFSFSVYYPYILKKVLNLGSTEFGIAMGSVSFGAFITSLLYPKIVDNSKLTDVYFNSLKALSILIFIVGFLTTPLMIINSTIINICLFSFFGFCFGASIVTLQISLNIYLQINISNEVRGRVLSYFELSSIFTPIAILIAGLLTDLTKTYIVLMPSGIVALLLVFSVIQANKKLISDDSPN